MGKSKHVCRKPKADQYEWPCRTCNPDYYTYNPMVQFYLLELVGDIEPFLHGPFLTMFGLDKKARSLREQDEGQRNGLYMVQQTHNKNLVVDAYCGGFFMKGPTE